MTQHIMIFLLIRFKIINYHDKAASGLVSGLGRGKAMCYIANACYVETQYYFLVPCVVTKFLLHQHNDMMLIFLNSLVL